MRFAPKIKIKGSQSAILSVESWDWTEHVVPDLWYLQMSSHMDYGLTTKQPSNFKASLKISCSHGKLPSVTGNPVTGNHGRCQSLDNIPETDNQISSDKLKNDRPGGQYLGD